MSKANMKFDLEWVLRYIDALEQYIQQEQSFMIRGTVQKIRETLETYGRNGHELIFERLAFLENNFENKESARIQVQQLRENIQAILYSI